MDKIWLLISEGIWDVGKGTIGSTLTLCLALAAYWYRQLRYRDWKVVLKNGSVVIDSCLLGVDTARKWVTDDWERKLGLKSFCADNRSFLNVNVLKISHVDEKQREFVIRFDENPPPPDKK